jgi:hypothetical protein
MNKKAFFLFILFAAVTGGIFAQLAWNGEFYTGLEFYAPHDSDAVTGQNHTDHHKAKGITQGNLTTTYIKDSIGFKMNALFQANEDPVSLVGAYGWFNFWDNQVRLSMGKISDGVWVTSLENEYVLDELSGFRVELKPKLLGGLNVGAAFHTGDPGAPAYTFKEFADGMVVGGSYIHPLFNVVAAYDRSRSGKVIGGLNYTGIYDLTDAGIEIKYNDFYNWKYDGYIRIDEKIGYRVMRPLVVSLRAAQTHYGDSQKDLQLLFNPEVTYKLNAALTVGLEAEVESPDLFKTVNLDVVPYLDYALPGAAYIYVQYRLSLADMKDADHSIGLGLTVKSF